MLSNQSNPRLPHWIVPALGSLMLMMPTASNFSTQQFQPTSNINRNAAALAIIAIGAGVIGWSWKSNRPSTASSNRSLQRNLLSLLHNDVQAANRLVQQAQAKYPGRSLDWCVEKVIYDLKRDRH